MSINLKGRVVENKVKYINEQGGSKLTYNFVTDPRLKRGHNFGIIYVSSSNYDEVGSLDGGSQPKKKGFQNINANLKNKTFTGQIKEKEEQEKKRNEKEGECGICTQRVTSRAHPTPITFEEFYDIMTKKSFP